MSEHTPGPWNCCIRSYGFDVYQDGEGRDAIRSIRGDSEAEANARLIAAAPDLLEACIKLVDTINEFRRGNDFPDEASTAIGEAAIAKATGGE